MLTNNHQSPAQKFQYLNNADGQVRVLKNIENPDFFRDFASKEDFRLWKQDLYNSFSKKD